jgi:serine/threonine-protein kinase TTK/MPS1
MSPEAIELPDGMRRLKVGRPSDVWSLGCILYQMVYGQPPFQHLSVYQKMKAIPDVAHVIDFPEFSTPSIPASKSSQNGGGMTPPKKLDHLKRRVRRDVIANMQSCLARNPKERSTIPELMEQDWLAMKERELCFASEHVIFLFGPLSYLKFFGIYENFVQRNLLLCPSRNSSLLTRR